MIRGTGIIPARYGSTRFPGKPLAPILGRPMIRWVYEGVRRARLLDRVLVATDDPRIADACAAFGAEAVLTAPDHPSGTDRVAEAARAAGASDIVVNVQGDEPLIDPGLVDDLVRALQDPGTAMASAMRRETDLSRMADPDRVKVVVDGDGFALYFSRAPIPWHATSDFFHHLGLYAYRKSVLFEFCALPPSRLETVERLEQLRALERGWRIRMIETASPGLSVDSPRDIIEVEKILGRAGA